MSQEHPATRHRSAALVGPYSSGKTTLLEALLHSAGAIPRKGSVAQKNTVGDASPEARARQMTIEPNLASCRYLDEDWSFIDCSGSVELAQDALAALMVSDIAVVVAEADPDRAVILAPLLRFLDTHAIPHILFINKLDRVAVRMRDLLAALQQVSARPLLLREVPIRDGDSVSGYVDLVSGRAYKWRENQSSDLIEAPEGVKPREAEARQTLLESLADFDDALLEQLLEDKVPAPKEIYAQLTRDLQQDLIVPVFFGSAEHGNGVTRLWKALRHEAPSHEAAAARLGYDAKGGGFAATVFKTQHQPHTGKLSLARLWSGRLADNSNLGSRRISGLYRLKGGDSQKLPEAGPGEIVGIARLEDLATGQTLRADGAADSTWNWPAVPEPVHAVALSLSDRKDDVKLTTSLAKLCEEDTALSVHHVEATGELTLAGQGDIQLQIAVERLKSRFNVAVTTVPTRTAYRETIRRPTSQHSRFKRQTGGHGQFADIHVEIRPQPRGAGFAFENKVVGGTVPRNYIPAVEAGAREALSRGPLGFPVVDIAVALTDGQHHSVDSSDQAFRTVAQMAMAEGLAKCDPVLLEPIQAVTIAVPAEYTAKVHAIVSSRRGQILGMIAREGWTGWDLVDCQLPESEMHGLAVELRSATLGVGSFTTRFDRLQELIGRIADQVVEERKRGLAA